MLLGMQNITIGTATLVIVLVALDIALFLLVVNSVKRGETTLSNGAISISMKRVERPIGFWFTIVLYSLIILGLSWFLIGAIVG